MTGSIATNFHEGSRSEILADYLFSGWGAITPVRRQDDHGVDLYGGLAERQGQRSIVTDYYVVQVKSTMDPWVFADEESVKWLVDYPLPLFLSCVDKSKGTLAVYHVTSRFYGAIAGCLQPRLELVPENGDCGEIVQWQDGEKFSLSAPILRVELGDFLDAPRLSELRRVFTHWVRFDRDNIDLRRRGLLRFRMPASYTVNEIPSDGIGEIGNAAPDDANLRRGIVALAEMVECVGGQLGRRGDLKTALLAALLLDQVRQHHADSFRDEPPSHTRLPAELSMIVSDGLAELMPVPVEYRHAGFDAVIKAFYALPLVERFLEQAAHKSVAADVASPRR